MSFTKVTVSHDLCWCCKLERKDCGVLICTTRKLYVITAHYSVYHACMLMPVGGVLHIHIKLIKD